MAFTENQSNFNQQSGTWRPHRYQADGNTPSKINYESELDLTSQTSLESIFMTIASQDLQINENNISQDRTSTTRKTSNVKTTRFTEKHTDDESLSECPICCNGFSSDALKQMPCCATKLCSSCLVTHTITNIRHGKVKIECPSCSQEINSSTILYNSEIPVPVRERYQEILAQNLSDKEHMLVKLCPHCNFITILDENDSRMKTKKSRRGPDDWIRCEQCEQEWCWSCYAPSHPNETCRHFKKNQSNIDMWANRNRPDNPNQRNARRCPKCSIYIEKIDGCDHMLCTKCDSKFCYRCGARMRLPYYIGHDAKYSIFGCKYKLWPNRPFLRWLIRGSIFTGALILTPVALGAVIALVALGIPIILIIGIFALPLYACVRCKKR